MRRAEWDNAARGFGREVLALVTSALVKGESSDEVLPRIDALVDSFATPPELEAPVFKLDDEQRMVWGWASVTTEGGREVTDLQGDVIPSAVMQKAAHEFMELRAGKTMHSGSRTATVVESIFFTNDLQKAMGIDLGREGWFVGVKVHDDRTWARVKSGELQAFSIGGSGVRTEILDQE